MAFDYTTVTGSASVIGSQRTISFNLNPSASGGTGSTPITTGLKYITGAGCTNNESSAEGFQITLNSPSNGIVTAIGKVGASAGVLTVFGYGGG